MTHLEMLDAVKRVFRMEGTEAEIDEVVIALDEAVPNANIIDMIFWPDVKRTPEQIVEEALRRQQAYDANNASKK